MRAAAGDGGALARELSLQGGRGAVASAAILHCWLLRPGRRAAERPLWSPSVRDGAERCRGHSDLDAAQGWGLRKIPFLG